MTTLLWTSSGFLLHSEGESSLSGSSLKSAQLPTSERPSLHPSLSLRPSATLAVSVSGPSNFLFLLLKTFLPQNSSRLPLPHPTLNPTSPSTVSVPQHSSALKFIYLFVLVVFFSLWVEILSVQCMVLSPAQEKFLAQHFLPAGTQTQGFLERLWCLDLLTFFYCHSPTLLTPWSKLNSLKTPLFPSKQFHSF